ncbi:MAG: glycosyltransferase [Candidatus Methanomethyliaceae archaeon]
MRVLFITAWYPTKEQPVGGVFVREHAKAVRLYDDVVVLHCAGPDPKLKELWRLGQESDESLTEGIVTYRVWHRGLSIPKVSYFIYLWGVFQAFRYITAHGFRPDIIHAHLFATGVPAVLIGRLYHIPVVITEHNSAFPRRLLSQTAILRARFAFRWADLVLAVSMSLQKAIEGYGIRARFQVVPNVVDTSLFFPRIDKPNEDNQKRLLFVGLLDSSHIKGVPYLLQALAQLRQDRDDWHLDIVGDGPARAEYERMVADLSLGNKITFHGLKTKSEVAEFMRQADLFVLPSLFETFSVITAEALATGIPVLATRCGGPEEFVTDKLGLLVPPGDADALCQGLAFLLNHLDQFSPGEISRYAKERFGPEGVGQHLHTVYVTALAEYGD